MSLVGSKFKYNADRSLWEKEDGVKVVDVSANGLLVFNRAAAQFKHERPKVYKDYVQLCVAGKMIPGKMKLYEVGREKIILLCNRQSDFGVNSNDSKFIASKTAGLLLDLHKFSLPSPIYSGIMGTKNAWSEIQKCIINIGFDWEVRPRTIRK